MTIHKWGRVEFDLEREIITWPNGTQSQFMRYATKRLPTDPAPSPKDLFRFGDRWKPTTVRSAVFQVPRKSRMLYDDVPTVVALLLIIAVITVTVVILGAI